MDILTIVLTVLGTLVVFGLIAFFIFRSEEKKAIQPRPAATEGSGSAHEAGFED